MKFTVFSVLMLIFLSCLSQETGQRKEPFTKGVYGNPGTLLKAGYAFDSLGMNAVFVRSISLNRDFYETARRQGCKIFVEFPTLNGKPYLQDHPDAWPVNEKGENSPPADWFMGICPTNPGFKQYRADQLRAILQEFDVDGIFLDYFHWHAQFETPDPILPETCFCDHCTTLFEDYLGKKVRGNTIPEKASDILLNHDAEWRKWRSSVLTGWIKDMRGILEEMSPGTRLGIYFCSWYPEDHGKALYRILGIEPDSLAAHADVLSPMLFHRMKGRPVKWVGEYLDWLGRHTTAGKPGGPEVWPIVQAHNNPGIISPAEFREVMLLGTRPPSSGIMMFSDVSLLQDTTKIGVMKDLYRNVIR